MTSEVLLTPAHWVYLASVLVIIVTMACRANVVAPAILGTLATAYAMTGQLSTSLEALFFGPLTAARELFNIFLVISLMTAFMNALRLLHADVRIVRPFRRIMVNGHVGFFVLALVSYVLSLFFWPTPSVPLIAGILLPAAIYAGVTPMAAALCIAISGLGTALSSDYIIKVGPGITAKAAAVPMTDVADKGLLLSLIVGAVALTVAYLRVRGTMLAPSMENLQAWEASEVAGAAASSAPRRSGKHRLRESLRRLPVGAASNGLAFAFASGPSGTEVREPLPAAGQSVQAAMAGTTLRQQAETTLAAETSGTLTSAQLAWSKVFAAATPVAFLGMVVFMVLPRIVPGFKGVGGNAAAALVGGVAALLMVLATAAFDYRSVCSRTAERVTEGFVFSFRAMSSVLPIAGFFFIGVAGTAGPIMGLPEGTHAPGLLADLVRAGDAWIPHDRFFVSFGILLSGMVTGIDGSGFAGLPLVGALSGALGRALHAEVSTLAAVGQMGSVWTGKTLTGWSALAAVAGFARVPVLEAVRQLLLPVTLGLIASTIFAALFWW